MREKKIIIILVEPSGPINIGSIARLCKNFGVKELRLVAPKCNPIQEDSIKMSMNGINILRNHKTFLELIDAISDCETIIATCGRKDHGNIPPLSTLEESIKYISETNYRGNIALVFGREDRGLTNQELLLADKVIFLESSNDYNSLNISHAVAIVLYKIFCSSRIILNKNNIDNELNIALSKEYEILFNEIEKLLLDIDYLLKHTASSRMSKLRIFLKRRKMSSEEVNSLRGIVRKLNWNLKNKSKE